MRIHEEFEWDDDKASDNLRKHRVSFDDAAAMLLDSMSELLQVEEF